LIAKLDVPVKQVMIEARIVVANTNFAKDLGVKWGVAHDNIGLISVLWLVVHKNNIK
jgi:type II secretory pathway component HofQ